MTSNTCKPLFQFKPSIETIINVSAFSSEAEREVARARIEEEIAICEAGVSYWKTKRNELSLIFRLPDELLVDIFRLLNDPKDHKFRWIQVSYVCHHWRKVALNDASLWASIPFHNIQWAREMLVRSKMVPLSVEISVNESTKNELQNEIITALTDELPRVRELSLMDLYDRDEVQNNRLQEIVNSINGPAPLLETCEIDFQSLDDGNEIPEALFSNSPHLVRLSLVNCRFNWQKLVIPSLTFLSIESITGVYRPSVRQIICAPTNMPLLEHLNLCINLTHSTENDKLSYSVAELPRLNYLRLGIEVHNCIHLLRRIIYPNTTSTVVILLCRDTSETRRLDLFQKISSLTGQRIKGRIIKNFSVQDMHLCIYTSSEDVTETSELRNTYSLEPQVSICVPLPSLFDPSSRIAATILRPFLLHDLEFLDVWGSCFLPDEWLNLFGEAPRLLNIHVGDGLRHFLDALLNSVSPSGVSPASEVGHAPCAKFKALRFLTIASNFDLPDVPREPQATPGRLVQCLRKRKMEGLALFSLAVKSTYKVIYEAEAAELRQCVEHVAWG